jgi:hypothetical protein
MLLDTCDSLEEAENPQLHKLQNAGCQHEAVNTTLDQ